MGTRRIPCSNCGKNEVTVGDYMEGDENEVVCDECETAAYKELEGDVCPICKGEGLCNFDSKHSAVDCYKCGGTGRFKK